MSTTIQKWGNSLAVRLPKDITEDRSLFEGCEVEVREEKGKIIITPVREQKTKKNLAKLVQGITVSNMHKDTAFEESGAQGKELW